MEKKYIYLILCKGSDGKFTTTAYDTLEKAQKALEMYVEAQKELEGLGDDVFINRHNLQRLNIPEFTIWDKDIISHVTINHMAHIDGKDRLVQTDRYIIRVQIN